MKKLILILAFLLTSNFAFAQFQNMEEIPKKTEEKSEEASEESSEEQEEEKSEESDGSTLQKFNSMIGNTGDEVPPHMIYYKERYEVIFSEYFFDEVWNATIEAIEATDCFVAQKSSRQDDDGFYKGKIVSDFCVLASLDMDENADVYDTLKAYSVKVPVIRGGIWKNGRIQYKVIIKEHEDETVSLLIKAEMSGYEDYVTNQVHFWESSGWLEHFLIEDIKARLEG